METHTAESGRTTLRATNTDGPSWPDVLAQWVRRLPGPAWVFWLTLWLVLLLLGEGAKWRDGSLAFGVIHPFHAVFNAVTIFMLAVCPVLDRVALRALEQTRPALDVSDPEYERWQYTLTTTPARPTVAANVIGLLAFGSGLAVFLDPVAFGPMKFDPSSAIDLAAIGANAIALSASDGVAYDPDGGLAAWFKDTEGNVLHLVLGRDRRRADPCQMASAAKR